LDYLGLLLLSAPGNSNTKTDLRISVYFITMLKGQSSASEQVGSSCCFSKNKYHVSAQWESSNALLKHWTLDSVDLDSLVESTVEEKAFQENALNSSNLVEIQFHWNLERKYEKVATLAYSLQNAFLLMCPVDIKWT
jgi:hypothetical protein